MARMSTRLKHAWNAFAGNPPRQIQVQQYPGPATSRRPDRPTLFISTERSIISAIYVRLGIDVASIVMEHCRTDDQGRFTDTIQSSLNNCLNVEANIDQAATMFRQDLTMTLLESGTAAIVPVDTTINPLSSGGWDVNTMRVGEVVQFYPQFVRVRLYNEKSGVREEITLPKNMVAIIENPLYQIMNEPNSTLKRLVHKLNLLDAIDDQSASGKLDLIIQLPYVVKSEARRQQANQRREDIEFQLTGSKYGIAYADGTEKITQLNRPITNNLMDQVTYLMALLYEQLGLTTNVMNGTAGEPEMLNYWNRTVEPIVNAITEEMKRKFLTKTARTQGQSIVYFRNIFALIPLGGDGGIADIADKFSRNEILAANEIRQAIGFKPSKDPAADQLQNSNMPQPNGGPSASVADPTDPPSDDGSTPPDPNVTDGPTGPTTTPDPATMGHSFDQIDSAINDAFSDLDLDDSDSNDDPDDPDASS